MSFPVVNGTEVLVAPPDGYQVNFSNPVFDTGTLNGHFWAFGVEFPIAVLFLAQRLYTSKFILRQFRIDDCKSHAPGQSNEFYCSGCQLTAYCATQT